MSTTTYPGTVDGAEQPELMLRNLRVGSRLWAASIAFFFIAFLFAFFYLRALNSNGLWRGWAHISKTHHTSGPNPSLAFGVAILICVLASAAVARGAVLLAPALWRIAIGVSILLALAAVGLQAAQFSSLGFGPTDGGYASVFVGWTGLFVLFLLGTVYWLGTVLGDNVRRVEIVPGLHAASVEAVSFVLGVLALVELAAFILLYIVA
jgi:heme/copper-type cytochrome/quinol oxidase subunit 3